MKDGKLHNQTKKRARKKKQGTGGDPVVLITISVHSTAFTTCTQFPFSVLRIARIRRNTL
ncbi:hypothetical protein EV356DRAFT_500141 [Viridothelium virens]|uniref:Uncharacterized protein n=1 Tax=Viridothelium virens TaxID=1048519 RepID=A0A6A6HBW5_VIRVR|nr:hypothetical protein EV356DRAFT_500141 [Viridothelium virens]